MNTKQSKLLKQLAKGLLKVPQEVFSFESWNNGQKPNLRKKGFDCGFVGCAIGWAPKLIKRCELKIKVIKHIGGEVDYLPFYKGETGEYAVMQYFGLTLQETNDLFIPDFGEYDTTPKDVSKKITQFLKRKNANASKRVLQKS